MTQIKKVKTSEGVQFYPQTHTKAVVDDNGYTVESRLQAMQDEINQAQLEVGAVPSDLTPTEGSSNWVTSGGVYNVLPKTTNTLFENTVSANWLSGNISNGSIVTTYANRYLVIELPEDIGVVDVESSASAFTLTFFASNSASSGYVVKATRNANQSLTTSIDLSGYEYLCMLLYDKPSTVQAQQEVIKITYKTLFVITGDINYAKIEDNQETSDLDVVDELDNIILRLEGGHIRTKYFDSKSIEINKIFENKKFSFIGDSITTYSQIAGVTNTYYPKDDVNSLDKTWWNILIGLCNSQLCRISATGGSCITDGKGTAPSFQLRYNSLFSNGESGSSPDYIFILGGINDWNTNTPLGNFTEEYSGNELPSTFIPSYRRLLYNLQITYPNSQIISLTPIRAFYGTLTSNYPPTKNGNNLNDYANAIVECCKIHGVVCVDLYNMFNLNLQNINTYTIDKLHPKAIMMEKMAKIIYQNIKNLF